MEPIEIVLTLATVLGIGGVAWRIGRAVAGDDFVGIPPRRNVEHAAAEAMALNSTGASGAGSGGGGGGGDGC